MSIYSSDTNNRERIAIVVVGFNRIDGLRRLLDSLNNAIYPSEDIPLVISIDASGNQILYDFVRSFEWKWGTKYVNIQEKRLGLKQHIFQCMSLSEFFRGVIILEDDLFVSPFFYNYAISSLHKYEDNDHVAAIALYAEETNGYVHIPFQPLVGEFDVFAWQAVCSWGEILNFRMWSRFSNWLENWDENFSSIDIIESIKHWDRAWSKYMYAYLVETGSYFIYPYVSLTTNFNDGGGEHGGGDDSAVQVSLLLGNREFKLGDFDSLIKYDIYYHNESIASWLGIDCKDLCVDYYGLRNVFYGKYILSPFNLPFEIVRGFKLCMRPWELNIKYNIEGKDFFLYRVDKPIVSKYDKRHSYDFFLYYLGRYSYFLRPRYVLKYYNNRLLKKLGI